MTSYMAEWYPIPAMAAMWPSYLRLRSKSVDLSGFGGLEDACWPLILKFAGSNPAEAVGFFRAKKFAARLPSEGKQSQRYHVVDLRHVKDS
jgi:hypothetical protein